jgi:flavodoxin
MLRTVIVYRSISGFTKKYAEWIAEELKADLFDVRAIDAQKISEYDLLIFGGSLHAVGINGIKVLKENILKLSDKKTIVFAVGASPLRESVVREIEKNNFADEEQEKIQLFYLRGGFNFGKLDFKNKVVMALFRVWLGVKKHKTPDERGMLAAYSRPIDCARKENIKEIVEYAQSLES